MRPALRRLVLAALALARSARADDPGLEALLETNVVSTASRQAETSSDAPATSSTLTADDLRRYGIRTLDEALNFLSLGVVSTNPLHSVEVGARGVLLTSDYGSHMMVLVNGHLLNEQWAGAAYFERGLGIPIELIDHIEVTLGPGSVLYGSNAMLGVIQVFTKSARDYRGLHLVGETELLTSGRLGAGFGHEFTLFGQPVEVTAQVEYFGQKGPTFTFGPQLYGDDAVTGQPKRFQPSGGTPGVWGGRASEAYSTQVPSGYVRVVAGPFELNARASSYHRATPYINSINIPFGDFDDPYNAERDRYASLDLRYRRTLSSIASLSTRLYGDLYDYQQRMHSSAAEDCAEGQDRGCAYHLDGKAQWVGVEPQVRFDWLPSGRLTTLVGADGRLRHYSSDLTYHDRETEAFVFRQGSYQRTESVLGVYLQQTARPLRSLSFNVGVRFDADTRFGSALSPRGSVAWTPWPGGTLKLIYSSGFRAPSGYEVNASDRTFQIKSEGLTAERERSLEASFEQRAGLHRLFFSAFRTWWSDLVTLEQISDAQLAGAIAAGSLPSGTSGPIYQYKNTNGITNYGFSAAYEGVGLDQRLRAGFNATAAVAHRQDDDTPDHPLTVSPRLFGNAHVSYAHAPTWPVAALAAQVTGPAYVDRAFDSGFRPLPQSPTQLTVRATLSGAMPVVKGLSYRVTATWARADRTAYVAGPLQYPTAEQPSPELAPVDTFRTALALYYTLD